MQQTKIISKRLLAIMLSLAMVFSLVQGGIFTASAETSGDYEYTVLDDGTVEITGYSGVDTEITIPSTLDEKAVTSISGYAFNMNDSITSINISESVTNIGNFAFAFCDALTSIEVAEGNPNYSSIDGVFYNKDKTVLIKYPSSKASASFTIPSTVKSIFSEAFYYAQNLTTVEIPTSVEDIGDRVFIFCHWLTNIKVAEDNANYISENGVLFSKDKTTLIQHPIAKTDTSYTIPNTVTRIGINAFDCCENLTSIDIPDSVESIGEQAFSLTGIYNNEENWENGLLYIGKYLVAVDENYISGEVTIKDGTKLIADNAFCFFELLTSVIIPDSVEHIGIWAFDDCAALESVTIGNGVKTIGEAAFENSGVYNNIDNWENGVLYIGDYLIKANENIVGEYQVKENTKAIADGAFTECDALRSVSVPNSVVNIGNFAFARCDALESIDVAEDNANYVSVNGVLYNKDKTKLVQFPAGKRDTRFTIENGIKIIDDGAFYDCYPLATVVISDSVEKIGDNAFSHCNLVTVNYDGTKEQWEKIAIGEGNEKLINATINYGGSGNACTHKNIVTDKAVAPTCEKTGLTEGSHCKDCGAKIKAQTVVKAKGHSTTTKNKKSATYFAKGYTGDTYCNTCKKVVKNGKSIAKKVLKTPKVNVTKGKKQFKVKYNKVSGATGFEVQYKVGKKTVTKSFNTKKSVTRAIKKLKKGSYKVKVRAFVKSGKKKVYSKWTKTYKVNVK